MNTFKFTIPEPSLTGKELAGKKKRRCVGHFDYVLALISFLLLLTFSNLFVFKIFYEAMNTGSGFANLGFFLVLMLCYYFSFYIPVRHLLVNKVKVDSDDLDNSLNSL